MIGDPSAFRFNARFNTARSLLQSYGAKLTAGNAWSKSVKTRRWKRLLGGAAKGMPGLALAAYGSGKSLRPVGVNKPRKSGEFGDPERRVTDILLAVNLLMFGAQLLTDQALTVWGLKNNALIARGQWWRFFTPALLHGSVMHLVLNCYALNNLGPLLETLSGHSRYLTLYTASAVAGTALSYAMSPANAVGASGAIFGVGGGLAVFFYRHKDFFGAKSDAILQQLGTNLAYNVIFGLMSPRIDNWGHMGGLIGGAFAAWLLGPKFVIVRPKDGRDSVLLDRPPLPLFAKRPRRLT